MPLIAFLLALFFLFSTSIVQASQDAAPTGQIVDINAASAQQLADSLPGIGPAKAARIVEWRDDNGGFTSVEQLQEVKGIGPKTLDKLRKHIRVGSSAAEAAPRTVSDNKEASARADVRRVVESVRLAASQASIAERPKRPWYKRSALEIFRTH